MLYQPLGIDAGGSGCNAAFPFDKGVLMMKKMNYPADYAVLSNEEMTYTTGGGAVDDAASLATTAATVVGAVVLASSYIWGIKQARTWLQQDGNKDGNFVKLADAMHAKDGNFFTVMGRATDALAADMGKSAGNFVRDAVSTIMVVALAPLSAILLVVR